jgi:hypothetical protein
MEIEKRPLLEEAENCRRQALVYLGQPEATLLLRVAEVFEDLATGSIVDGVKHQPGLATDDLPSA